MSARETSLAFAPHQRILLEVAACTTSANHSTAVRAGAAAFKAGTVALYRLIPDVMLGPRTPGEGEDAAPVG
ncbi:hypothetical protein [Variovorax saccharolyticus]|uniref:hypothetical protein n=1 Tax=Variovorax saccharolyticus TaxID=3053516 RepID=UPI002579196D|nr:hypothetical protein [Variovorax sp. J31P216]MDM0025925.1 hypothetical protein [Variovorax sp. J31P216]